MLSYPKQCGFLAGFLQLFVHFDFLPWFGVQEDVGETKDSFDVLFDVDVL